MPDDDFPYSRSLAPLESLLAGVKRPGNFCVHGALALPLPMVQVDGVGLLSLPLEDIAAMRALQALGVAAPDADRARLAAAVARQPQAVED